MSQRPVKLLAIDTATEACSVAVQVEQSVYACFEVCPQQHSQKIVGMVETVLEQANIKLSDLNGIVFGQGPGSFTGVRIATGIVQGLAFGADLPVLGVSTLATMAQQAVHQQNAVTVVSAIDARMSEVYLGVYENVNGLAQLVGQEGVYSPEEAQSHIPVDTEFAAVGTGWKAALLTAKSNATQILYPQAEFMLPLAQHAWCNNQFVEVDAVQPVYLRDKVTWKKLPGRE